MLNSPKNIKNGGTNHVFCIVQHHYAKGLINIMRIINTNTYHILAYGCSGTPNFRQKSALTLFITVRHVLSYDKLSDIIRYYRILSCFIVFQGQNEIKYR